MPEPRGQFDPNKWLNRDLMRLNLLLASSYLAAYELLKTTIVGVRSYFVWYTDIPVNKATEIIEALGEKGRALVQNRNEEYRLQIEEYERQVGIDYVDDYERRGLIESCNYLERIGVLSASEIANIRRIREHRNQIAHELPDFLSRKEYNVNLDLFNNMVDIMQKVGAYWVKMDSDVPSGVPDHDIYHGSMIAMSVIWLAVREYSSELRTTQAPFCDDYEI